MHVPPATELHAAVQPRPVIPLPAVPRGIQEAGVGQAADKASRVIRRAVVNDDDPRELLTAENPAQGEIRPASRSLALHLKVTSLTPASESAAGQARRRYVPRFRLQPKASFPETLSDIRSQARCVDRVFGFVSNCSTSPARSQEFKEICGVIAVVDGRR
jgi:hypothetical protein